MRNRTFLMIFPLFLLIGPAGIFAGPPLPNPSRFSNISGAVSTNRIKWYSVKGTNTGMPSTGIRYKFAGESNTGWLLSRSNIVINLFQNTQYTERVIMRSNITGPSNQWSTNSRIYTFVPPPAASYLTVTPVGSDSMAVSVRTCHNAYSGQTGCRFTNLVTAGSSPLLTGRYAWTNTGLLPDTFYAYKARYKNGDAVWTLTNSGMATNYTLAATPVMESVLANYTLLSNYFTRVYFNSNGNPSSTRYAIQCTNTGLWLWGDGSATNGPKWRTRSGWHNGRNCHTNLAANTYYGYRVQARNENLVTTPFSGTGKDLTPPAAPSGVTAFEINDDLFFITWAAAPGASDYSVYIITNRRNVSRSNYTHLFFKNTASCTDERNGGAPFAPAGLKATNTSATDTSRLRVTWDGVTQFFPGTNFFYSIRARKADGKAGAFSAPSTGISNITPVVTGYEVFRGSAVSNMSSATVFTDTGLSANTRYDFQVKAFSSDSLEGGRSSWASNYTAIQSPAYVVFNTVSSNAMTVSASGSYNNLTRKNSGLYFSNTTNGSASGWFQVNSWNSTALMPNKKYGFRARARNAEGLETPECSVSNRVTLCRVPPSPIMLTNDFFTNAVIVMVRSNKNPVGTEYAVSNLATGEYLQPDGSLNSVPAWRTFIQWGGFSGITNKGLEPSVNYTYKVRARNSEGLSTVASSTSFWRFTLARVPSNLRPGIWSTTNIPLLWHNQGASYFGIECALDSGGAPGAFIYLRNYNDKYALTNFIHTGLWPDSTYWYRVRGYNGNGRSTSTSVPVAVTTTVAPPEAPTNFRGKGWTTNSILWEWTDRSASEIFFIVKETNGASVSGLLAMNTVSYAESPLAPNTVYRRFVIASNSYGKSPSSGTNRGCTLAPPPFDLKATLHEESNDRTSVRLEWGSSRATSFLVQRSLAVNGAVSAWDTLEAALPSGPYVDAAVLQSNSYFYRVASVNRTGEVNTNFASAPLFFVRRFMAPRGEFIEDNYISGDEKQVRVYFEILGSGAASVKVYNAAGRLVRTVLDSNLPAGKHYYEWLLNNDENKQVARGIYFIHIRGPDGINKTYRVFVAR